jgi:uncharacterized membrane protein
VARLTQRLTSIDMLRGLVMVLMALDHVRDMLTQPPAAGPSGATDFSETAGILFLTRWVTHICAPTFVFLAGVSACLYRAAGRRPRSEVARFLLSRGIWLVFIEVTVVNFAWNFNLRGMLLQVIWAIGCSMIALAPLIWLPRSAIAAVGAAMVLGHNALDFVQPPPSDASALWLLLHIQGLLRIGGTPVAFVVYPLIPWIGLMALGYAIGPYFLGANPARPRRLVQIGALLMLAFVLLRMGNLYGEPVAWAPQGNLKATLISFFNTTKYPPSLQFLLMTLGPALMLLGWFERKAAKRPRSEAKPSGGGPPQRLEGRIAGALVTIGRVPFFFYIVHLYVIHSLAVAVGLAQGFSLREMAVLFFQTPPGFGVSLGSVYLIWALVLLALYPACVWFARVKARRSEWWIRYL